MTAIATTIFPIINRALALSDLAIRRMDDLLERTEAMQADQQTRKESSDEAARLREGRGKTDDRDVA